MLGRLNHVAIAVKDAEKAAKIYGGAFGAEISGAVPLPEHGVITVFVTLPNTKIEFIQPLGEASPIAKFVERNADGGIHHICYDVPDSISTAFAIYFVLWWLILFLTLPFGVRSQHEDGESAPGTDPGAPVLARMGYKLLWTTLISGVIFGIGMWAYHQGYLNIERLSRLMGLPF